MKRHNISVKWTLFKYLCIFVAVMLVLLWFFQTVFLNEFYRSIKTSEIKALATSISRNVNNENFEAYVSQVANQKNTCVLITNGSVEQLYNTQSNTGCRLARMSPYQLYDLVANTINNGGSYLEEVNTFDWVYDPETGMINHKPKMDGIIYSKVFKAKNDQTYVIMLNTMITPLNATVETIRIQLIWITGLMLLFALILAFVISKTISKPIIGINTASKELAKGNYNIRFENSGYKEISELANTLNYASAELGKVNAYQQELIANISHDLRTPLTMIAGYAEVMRDLPGEDTKENIQVVIDEAKRLTILVNDVLDLSKLTANVMTLERDTINATKCIRDIIYRYQALLEQDSYTILLEADCDVYIDADEIKLTQVLYNLLNNAITYTGSDKTVIVSQTITDDMVRIAVIDHGEGIAQDKLADIWERYYKIDKAHRRAQVGTGLGLSIVKQILDLHQVPFGVDSILQEGSTFYFSFPILKTESHT